MCIVRLHNDDAVNIEQAAAITLIKSEKEDGSAVVEFLDHDGGILTHVSYDEYADAEKDLSFMYSAISRHAWYIDLPGLYYYEPGCKDGITLFEGEDSECEDLWKAFAAGKSHFTARLEDKLL